jgi:hypothetical protein
MSLELAIQENTAAVKELVAALNATNAARTETLAKVEALAAEKPKARATKAAAETPAATTAASPPPPPPPAAAASISVKELGDAFGEYLGIEDEAERTKRKTFVKEMLVELGAARVGEIAEADRGRAMQLLRNKIQGDKHKFESADDDLI